MIRAGLDVARINFSHGTSTDHRRRARAVRAAARKHGKPLALLADLQGPRFRVGSLEGGRLDLKDGAAIELLPGKDRSRAGTIPVSYSHLAKDVKRGDPILMDDGKLELRVTGIRSDSVRAEVVRGGPLTDNKGINLPGSSLSAPALTPKDRRDLEHSVELGADWLAISFVRRAADVTLARRLLRRAGRVLPVMAKIERPEAIDELDGILRAADGLLVARGDLGVELPPERVPVLQKQIIEAANRAGKPVMTATQMLESMREARRPTRAEASDVANAVLDGSSCLLLTAETAVGRYPVDAVAMMASIIQQAESSGRTRRVEPPEGELSVTLTTCKAGCRAAYDVGAPYLVVFTQTGFSAAQVARFHPSTPILAYTPSREVSFRIQMLWGVEPRTLPSKSSIEELMRALDRRMLQEKLVKKNDIIVVLSGSPVGMQGTTNLMQLHRVGAPVVVRSHK
jgi:pyruvate kinase